MSHSQCLIALKKYNAEEHSIDLVHAFLYGRLMSVKIVDVRSQPRTVPGGSPQGSILGNFLFCVSTRELAELEETSDSREYDQSTVSFENNGLSGSEVSSDRERTVSPISRPAMDMLGDLSDHSGSSIDNDSVSNYRSSEEIQCASSMTPSSQTDLTSVK